MQETRQQILEILRERQQATVDDIVSELCQRRGKITSVTVRHHLQRLQNDGIIAKPQVRRRKTPGRPQHVYTLTDEGKALFPNNYQNLAHGLLRQLQRNLPDDEVNVILENVAEDMAQGANIREESVPERLNKAVEYLNQLGYEASWEKEQGGYLLHTKNCPYHQIAHDGNHLCEMDMRFVTSLIGRVPRLTSRMSSGGATCSYFIPITS